jgi:S1-C subfamily serine protease
VQLRNGLALLRVGQSVELRLLRKGAERSVTLTINPPSSLNPKLDEGPTRRP